MKFFIEKLTSVKVKFFPFQAIWVLKKFIFVSILVCCFSLAANEALINASAAKGTKKMKSKTNKYPLTGIEVIQVFAEKRNTEELFHLKEVDEDTYRYNWPLRFADEKHLIPCNVNGIVPFWFIGLMICKWSLPEMLVLSTTSSPPILSFMSQQQASVELSALQSGTGSMCCGQPYRRYTFLETSNCTKLFPGKVHGLESVSPTTGV